MAKESMKAREVKRQRMVAKYAAKKEALKKAALADENGEINYEALTKLQKLPATLHAYASTTAARSQAVPKDTCVSSESQEFSSAKWHPLASSPALRKQAGNHRP